MARRNKRKKRTTRADRRLQLLVRLLLFLAVVSFSFFFILQRIEKNPEADDTASVDAISPYPGAGSSQGTGSTQNPEETTPAEDVETSSTPSEDATVTTTPIQTATPTPTPTPTAAELAAIREKERQGLLALEIEDLARILREEGVPEDLVVFMEEYPESKEFVLNYLYQPEDPPSKDISGEVQKGTIPHFLQWDERWGYDFYDDSYFAVAGCGPTALSEVYCGLTGKTDLNPYEMGVWATERGYHIRGQGTSWEMMWSGAQSLGLSVWQVDFDADAIVYNLQEGYPIICAVSPGDFTHFGHFIVLAGVDKEGNISVRDSNSIVRTERTWTADELLWQISSMWAYNYEGA